MRFVTNGRMNGQRFLSTDERVAVTQFEEEQANPSQQLIVGGLMQEAHDKSWWLECDCSRDGSRKPLVAPVLREGSGLYWRMLNGPNRLAHSKDCCFHRRHVRREQAAAWSKSRRKRPDGFFAVLKKTETVEPRKAGTGSSTPSQQGSRLPALAKMLHGLLENAGLHSWRPGDEEHSINNEFKKLYEVTSCFDVAPGIPLKKVFFKFAPDWGRPVFGRIRNIAGTWPDGHRPQGFICYLVPEVNTAGARIQMTFRGKELDIDIRCAGSVKYPSINGNLVAGPYLFFGVVGLTRKSAGYQLQRAWAQPIADNNHFVPVDSDYERKAFRTLKFTAMRLQNVHPEYDWHLEKPLFEYDTPEGPCLPDFLIIGSHKQSGRKLQFVIEVMGFERASYLAGKEITHPRMETLGPVIKMDGKKFATDPSGDGPAVTQFIMEFMKREN